MNKALIYVFILVMSASVVSAVEFNYSLNISMLPFNDTKNILLAGDINSTSNIIYGNFTSGVSNITFTETVMSLDIFIDVSNTTLVGNYTDLIKIDNVTHITFNFNVFNGTLVFTPDVGFIMIDERTFEYNVCDYLLPWNTTKDITIQATENTIYTEYDSGFFSMPDNFEMPASNITTIDILIHLSSSLVIGSYSEDIRFSISDENKSSVTFNFNILDCVTPITVCDEIYNDVVDACQIVNKTSVEILACKGLEVEYEVCIYNALLDAAESRVVNNTITEYINNTEYVPVYALDDEELAKALKEIPTTWKAMQSDQRAKKATIRNLENELKAFRNDETTMNERINSAVKQGIQDLVQENILQRNTINYLTDKYWKKTTIISMLVLLSLIGGGWYAYKRWYEDDLW